MLAMPGLLDISRVALLAVTISVVGGCGGTRACADLDEEVLLTAQLTDNGTRTRVEVELRRPDLAAGSIPVKLCEDHALRVDEVRMTEVKRPSGAVIYEVELASDTTKGPVTRRLELRSPDDTSEYTATLDAPGFRVTAPAAGSELSRAAELTVTWDPPRAGDAKISIKVTDEIDGDACLAAPLELEEPDDGEAVVAAAAVELTATTPPANGKCEAFLTLSRSSSATLERVSGPGGLHPDSRVKATTSRAVTFLSGP